MRSDASREYRGSRASYALIAALLVLLPVLAVLQYRWIGQLSQDERQRLGETLSKATNHVAQDLTLEAVRLYLSFQILEKPSIDAMAGEIADRLSQWNATSTRPQVVKQISLVKSEGDRQALFHFEPETNQLTPVEWPPALAELQRQLGQPASQTLRAWRPPLLTEGTGPARDLRAVVPVRPMRPPVSSPAEIHNWTIVELDTDYITKEFLPALIGKYFPPSGEYRVAVVDETDARRVLYKNDPSLSVDQFKSPDAKVELFGVEFARLAILGRAAAGLAPLPGAAARGRPGIRFLESQPRVRWQMLVQHSSGSLDKAVSDLRRRDLEISFGILLVLTVAVGMVIVFSERARALGRLQMELAASVSHELKTPLAVIRSAAYNLESGVVDSKEDVRRYAAMLRDAGRRLSEMVDQVLTFAETQSQRRTFELRPIDIRDVIEQALDTIRSTSAAAADVRTEVPAGLPMVQAEPTALTYCLQNLIVNALKYAKGEASGSANITISAERFENEVRLNVTDTGSGIDREDLRHLFQPFFRGKNAEGIPGSGLGLNLVYRMIEAQGGRVTVKTEPHRGSSFTLHIPIAPNGAA